MTTQEELAHPHRKRLWIGGLLLILVLGATLLLMQRPAPELQVRTTTGEELLRISLKADPTWTIEWIHSVAQVQIRDAFTHIEGRIRLTDQYTPFIDIAGLGHIPGRGELRDDGNGGYWIAGINADLYGGVHRLILGSERAPTTLVHAGQRYELSATHPGTHAIIEVITQ